MGQDTSSNRKSWVFHNPGRNSLFEDDDENEDEDDYDRAATRPY
jgi:hypothetical protein